MPQGCGWHHGDLPGVISGRPLGLNPARPGHCAGGPTEIDVIRVRIEGPLQQRTGCWMTWTLQATRKADSATNVEPLAPGNGGVDAGSLGEPSRPKRIIFTIRGVE